MTRLAILLACLAIAAPAVAEETRKPAKTKKAKKPKKPKAKKPPVASPGSAGARSTPEGSAESIDSGEIEMDAVDAKPASKPAKGARKLPPKPESDPEPAPLPEPTPAPVEEPSVAISASASVSINLRTAPRGAARPSKLGLAIDSAPLRGAARIAAKPRSSKQKRFYVRGGFARVVPLSQSRELELADVDGAASLAIDNGPVEGSGASVSSATILAATLGVRINERFSVETVIGAPFTVKLQATGTLASESLAPMALGIPTGVPPLGSELGEAKAAPPTVTLVYQLRTRGAVRPYVGSGLSVLFAYDEKVTNPVLTEVSEPDMSIAPAPGLVLQAGAEARLWRNVYFRADVKFIALMMARAKVEHIQVATPELPVFDTVEVGTAKMNVWVNPLIIQLGVGADF